MTIALDRWEIRDLVLTKEKAALLWNQLQKYSTLFSDHTRGDSSNFAAAVTSTNTLWYEVRDVDLDAVVGLIWFEYIPPMADCTVHLMFFDRRPHEKLELCREMLHWMFQNFPINRITATPPVIYHATIRLLEKLGFTREGLKRQALLMEGKWVGQTIYGITRDELPDW